MVTLHIVCVFSVQYIQTGNAMLLYRCLGLVPRMASRGPALFDRIVVPSRLRPWHAATFLYALRPWFRIRQCIGALLDFHGPLQCTCVR